MALLGDVSVPVRCHKGLASKVSCDATPGQPASLAVDHVAGGSTGVQVVENII